MAQQQIYEGLMIDGITAIIDPTSGALKATNILATITGINAQSVANTLLYTVPTGKTLIVTGYNVRVTAATAITTGASAGLGNVAGTNNISASQAMTTLTTLLATFMWPIVGISLATASAGTIYFNLGTGAIGTSQTIQVDLLGYLQ